MNIDDTRYFFKRLRFSLIASWVSLLLMVILLNLELDIFNGNGQIVSVVEIMAVIILLFSVAVGFMFYYYLSCLAGEFSKSAIVWVVLPFITAPIGPIIAYFKMKKLVH